MALLFSQKVFKGAVAGTSTEFQYSDESSWQTMARAETLFFQMKTSQTSVTPTIKVELQSSNDGIEWSVKSTPFNLALTQGVPQISFANDAGATPSGSYVRLRLSMTAGASPSALVEISVAGRSR